MERLSLEAATQIRVMLFRKPVEPRPEDGAVPRRTCFGDYFRSQIMSPSSVWWYLKQKHLHLHVSVSFRMMGTSREILEKRQREYVCVYHPMHIIGFVPQIV